MEKSHDPLWSEANEHTYIMKLVSDVGAAPTDNFLSLYCPASKRDRRHTIEIRSCVSYLHLRSGRGGRIYIHLKSQFPQANCSLKKDRLIRSMDRARIAADAID